MATGMSRTTSPGESAMPWASPAIQSGDEASPENMCSSKFPTSVEERQGGSQGVLNTKASKDRRAQ